MCSFCLSKEPFLRTEVPQELSRTWQAPSGVSPAQGLGEMTTFRDKVSSGV